MRLWFLTARFARERAAIAALSSEEWFVFQRWCIFEAMLCVEAVICVRGAQYPVRLMYPDQFPQVPAWVEPQDRAAKWSSHQYGPGGTLCLELRPDTWDESATGADVLWSAFRLLDLENPLGPEADRAWAPSAHNVGSIQSYGLFSNPLFISAGCIERIRAHTASELKAGHSPLLDEIVPLFVHDSVDRSGPQFPPTTQRPFAEVPVFVSREAAPKTAPANRSELRALARLQELDDARLAPADDFALLIFDDGVGLVGFLALTEAAAPLRLAVVPIADTAGRRSGRLANRKRVAVVGCGSVGSRIAECLLRSGVHDLALIDGDVMLPENLERHALDWRDVGYRKVKALTRRLLTIVPGSRIAQTVSNLNWQRSARTHAAQVDVLANSEVIVDATGDVPTSLFLGAIAAENKKSFVSVEVFEGGIGALIASCVPGRDPAYGRARAAFLEWCKQRGVPVRRGTGRRYEALADDGEPMVADDAAVTIAAGHGARVILDILDGRPAPPQSAWLLIGLQPAWVFDGHGATIRLSVGTPDDDEPVADDPEALEFVSALFKEAAGEDRPPG